MEATSERRTTLPNGLSVAYRSKAELDQFYDDLFEKDIYLRAGITLRPGDTVFDVGSNIGLFSLSILHRFPDVRVFAFEPAPPLHALLVENTHAFGERIRCFAEGLADRVGEATLTYYPHTTGMSSFFADPDEERRALSAILENRRREGGSDLGRLLEHADELLDLRLASETFHCPLSTVSEMVRGCGVERIDLLKVDVEKSEAAVLAGIEEAHWPKIEQIAAEVHDTGGRLEEIRKLTEARGFATTLEQDELYRGSDRYNLYAVRGHLGGAAAETAKQVPERRQALRGQAMERASRQREALARRPWEGGRRG
jgi:phthiocerol/phenolphthiocerol synthesis type-I polyketide synthase E